MDQQQRDALNTWIRGAEPDPAVVDEDQADAQPVDFDGGARTTAPPEPDMSALIRRAVGLA